MSVKKPALLLSLVGISALSLHACSHPNAMATGYTYHNDVYKSAVPPLPMDINDEQRTYMTASQARQFRDATYELMERLTMRAGMPPKPVYVLTPIPMNNFYSNIDNDLRESMRYIGYALSDTPDGAYVMTYNASAIDMEGVNENVRLIFRVFDKIGKDARLLTEESGEYYIEGADTLIIRPVSYASQPSEELIRNQVLGYKRLENPDAIRTVPYVETDPVETVSEDPVPLVAPPVQPSPTVQFIDEPNPVMMQPPTEPDYQAQGRSYSPYISSKYY